MKTDSDEGVLDRVRRAALENTMRGTPQRLYVGCLGTSPARDWKVALGEREGWLRNHGGDMLDILPGVLEGITPEPFDLFAAWKAQHERRSSSATRREPLLMVSSGLEWDRLTVGNVAWLIAGAGGAAGLQWALVARDVFEFGFYQADRDRIDYRIGEEPRLTPPREAEPCVTTADLARRVKAALVEEDVRKAMPDMLPWCLVKLGLMAEADAVKVPQAFHYRASLEPEPTGDKALSWRQKVERSLARIGEQIPRLQAKRRTLAGFLEAVQAYGGWDKLEQDARKALAKELGAETEKGGGDGGA